MNLEPAIAQLLIAAETCENNAPINEAEGNHDQAELERKNAKSYRAGIELMINGQPCGHEPLVFR